MGGLKVSNEIFEDETSLCVNPSNKLGLKDERVVWGNQKINWAWRREFLIIGSEDARLIGFGAMHWLLRWRLNKNWLSQEKSIFDENTKYSNISGELNIS